MLEISGISLNMANRNHILMIGLELNVNTWLVG